MVPTDQGVVPVAKRRGRGQFGTRLLDGALMTLDQWPAGELLPSASCACHEEVLVSLYEARGWVESGRDKVTYKPYAQARTENL